MVSYLGKNAPPVGLSYRILQDGPVTDVTPTTPLPVGSAPLTLAQLQALTPVTLDVSHGTVNQHVSKATPGAVVAVIASNANAAVRYFQLFNKATAPVNTDVPVISIPINASGGNIQISFAQLLGAPYQPGATGVAWAVSTTNATLTLATAADHNVQVFYI